MREIFAIKLKVKNTKRDIRGIFAIKLQITLLREAARKI